MTAAARPALAPAAGWFRPADAEPEAKLRLFLFHCAGGGASMFHHWLRLLPSAICAQCVQLPGRQDRWSEPAHTGLASILKELERQFRDELDERPYAFFGHSMGALVAYRLAARLGLSGQGPALLAASGWAPEGFHGPPSDDRALDDAEIIVRMRELGALPLSSTTGQGAASAANPDFVRFVLPAMRADLEVCAGYIDDRARAGCPIVAYAGADDPLMASAAMDSWKSRTGTYLGTRVYPGGHFFLDRAALEIVSDLTAEFFRQTAD